MKTPTFGEVVEMYKVIARVERLKNGRPGVRTVRNVVSGALRVIDAAGLSAADTVDAMTRRRLDDAVVRFLERGVSRLTAREYASEYRALFAKWCAPRYADAGWRLPAVAMPFIRAKAPGYVRPDAALLGRVKEWYAALDDALWFPATMMLEFAMRNSDVMRLRRDNFVERPRGWFLSYVPHKTAYSSGRRVLWPVHDAIWRRLERAMPLGATAAEFDELNRQMRGLGFTGAKASYELRKICIDHVYQRFGAEMATSISGDDIRTITRYYADPSQPNALGTRIVDLL